MRAARGSLVQGLVVVALLAGCTQDPADGRADAGSAPTSGPPIVRSVPVSSEACQAALRVGLPKLIHRWWRAGDAVAGSQARAGRRWASGLVTYLTIAHEAGCPRIPVEAAGLVRRNGDLLPELVPPNDSSPSALLLGDIRAQEPLLRRLSRSVGAASIVEGMFDVPFTCAEFRTMVLASYRIRRHRTLDGNYVLWPVLRVENGTARPVVSYLSGSWSVTDAVPGTPRRAYFGGDYSSAVGASPHSTVSWRPRQFTDYGVGDITPARLKVVPTGSVDRVRINIPAGFAFRGIDYLQTVGCRLSFTRRR